MSVRRINTWQGTVLGNEKNKNSIFLPYAQTTILSKKFSNLQKMYMVKISSTLLPNPCFSTSPNRSLTLSRSSFLQLSPLPHPILSLHQSHQPLLDTTRHQLTLFVPNPLQDQTPPVSRPRTLALTEQPLIGTNISGPMEIYRMIKRNHHPDSASGRVVGVFPLLEPCYWMIILGSVDGGRGS